MASPRKGPEDRTIARTYRAAIRIGEDFITLEETITLPLDASDDEVQQAVDLGWKIYQAQRAAADAQVADIREHNVAVPAITIRDPDSPASEKQRSFIATLQEQLGWSSEQMSGYARDQHVDLVTITKGQASTFIDGLKKLADERQNSGAQPAAQETAPRQRTVNEERASYQGNGNGQHGNPVTEQQITALNRLAQRQQVDLAVETRRRYGADVQDLSFDQASALLRDLQPRRA